MLASAPRPAPSATAALAIDEAGHPVIRAEGCVGCGVCVRACITVPSSFKLRPAGDLMPDVPYRVDKPWGYELIWARTDRYVGKMLHVKAGHVLSLQYHNVKDETMHVLSRRADPPHPARAPSWRRAPSAPGSRCTSRPGSCTRSRRWWTATCSRPRPPELDDLVRL